MLPGFWGALKRSGLTLDQVRGMSADDLQKRLQRNVKYRLPSLRFSVWITLQV